MGGIMKRIQVILLCTVMLMTVSLAFAQNAEWLWAAKAGGIYNDSGKDIATDSAGNNVVIGYFSDTATFGNITLSSAGGYDAYVAKMDTNGNWLWAKRCGGPTDGGPNVDWGYSVALDSASNVYITGYFNGSATFGATTLTGTGMSDIFIAKLDANGNWLWATKAGGTRYDYSNAIAVDANGNVFVTGCFSYAAAFNSVDSAIPPINLNCFGNMDIFVAKLSTAGNFEWAKAYGGTEHDYGYNILSDGNGSIFMTGIYRGTANFDTHQLSSNGDYDVFVAKLSSAGECAWVKSAGGAVADWGYGLSVDSNHNVFVAGAFTGTITFGATVMNSTGNEDFFLAKMNNNGDWLWAVKAGSTNTDIATAICNDSAGNCYITGYFTGTISFDNENLSTVDNDYDIAVAAISPSGEWLWAKRGGGLSSEFSSSIGVDASANIYITGNFFDTAEFDAGHTIISYGASDTFVAKLALRNTVDNDDSFAIYKPSFVLKQNYPNPFNANSRIEVEVNDNKAPVELSIYNMKGRKVRTMHQGMMNEGNNSLLFNGLDDNNQQLPSGVYFYRVSMGGNTETRRMILTR